MLIDTHAHLWFPEYTHDLTEVMARAKEAGIEKMVVPGTDIESSKKAIELAKKYPGIIYAAVGIHPEEVEDTRFQILEVRKLIEENIEKVVAIGEIGTDKNGQEMQECINEQMELFKAQCELALEKDLPVIVHTRDSFAETWEVLTSLSKMPRGQFHCFSVDEAALQLVLDKGFYVSFCGNITWSKRVVKLVALVPDERLLLETDSPLMVPRNKKGQPVSGNERNEPANVKVLAEKIAELRGQTLEQIEEMTSKNAKALFKL